MIQLTFDQLYKLLTDAGETAVQAYKRDIEPLSDRINQADAKKWLVACGFKPVMLSKWVDSGLITKTKDADARQNAQAFYSKTELRRAMSAAELSAM